jgi:hypothetical protein
LSFLGLLSILFALIFVHAAQTRSANDCRVNRVRHWAAVNRITDLCLFPEATYSRHPAMGEIFAPFQDHPMALEHFPAGSFLTPVPGGKQSITVIKR